MAKKLSHITATGDAHMVDVSGKTATLRKAVAEGYVLMAHATVVALRTHSGPKGEAISVARIAGILAAKKTGELIPLCHPLPVEQVTVDVEERVAEGTRRNHECRELLREHIVIRNREPRLGRQLVVD